MGILRKFFIFSILYIFSVLVSNAQESGKKSKYIHPTIESDSVFQNAILSQRYVVIDFWAVWCKPCQLFLPEYEEIAKRFYKKVGFYKLDIDKCQATAKEYDTKMIPVIIVFKNGKEAKRYVGLTAKERIVLDLEKIMETK
ncbi:MAG: thioredoxin family protein [Bacteroidales bacterium]|jgi:thioredoxin 1